MEERTVATIDLGSSKIALTIAKINNDDVKVIYYKETPSDGINESAVYNPMRASVAISKAISEAENELKIKILQVIAGLPRYEVRQEKTSAQMERTDPESCITQEEIDFLKSKALNEYPLEDEKDKVYGAVAQSFSTDELVRMPESDIVGSVSGILEGNFKVFIGRKTGASNLEKVFQQLGLAISTAMFVPDATADAVLSEEEKDNGVALIDMGAGVTSVTIFQGGILRHYGAIPFGSGNITSDIRYECSFSKDLAENIKLGYGACLPDKLQSMSEKILKITNEEDGTSKDLQVRYLSQIINARQKEIFEAMLYEIEISGYADRLRSGVVITGGGAALTNSANLLREMSGYDIRIGFPRMKHFTAGDCPDIMETSATASVGMLMRARRDKWLNCIEDPATTAARLAEEKRKEEAEKEPDYTNTVFEENGGNEKPENPEPKKKKPRQPKVTFFKRAAEKGLGLLGSLYENIDG